MLFWDTVQDYHVNSENEDFEFSSTNPCFTGDMELLTKDGFIRFDELNGDEVELVGIHGDISEGKVWATGIKDTIRVRLSNGQIIKCTPDHVFMDINGSEIEARKLKGKKIMPQLAEYKKYNDKYVKYGFIQGDGQLTRLNSKTHKGIEVLIGEDDGDMYKLFANDEYTETSAIGIYLQGDYKSEMIELGFSPEALPERKFPSSYDEWTNIKKASFLQGMFSANGSVTTGHRVSYKTSCRALADKLKETLHKDFGIHSNITINKEKKVEFSNGEYLCKESYDVNINRYESQLAFNREINFYHDYKKAMLRELLIQRAPYVTSIVDNGSQMVYDFNEPQQNWGIVNGYIAHNCGELPLPEGGSCLLSSINLSEYVINPFSKNSKIDYSNLKNDIPEIVKFMDDVLEEGVQYLPLEHQRRNAEEYRQIGIGTMGFADMLIKLGLTYGSKEANEISEELMSFIANEVIKGSSLLAKQRGSYPKYNKDVLKSSYIETVASRETKKLIKKHGLRNGQLLSIAPNGSISTLMGVSGGIEPIFALSHNRRSESLGDGEDVTYKVYADIVKDYKEVTGSDELPSYFVTSHDIHYKDRVKFQGIIQRYIDNAISSTVNLPNDATVKDVEDLYMLAWENKLKGITVYRDGCLREGILTTDDKEEDKEQLIDIDDCST